MGIINSVRTHWEKPNSNVNYGILFMKAVFLHGVPKNKLEPS